VVLAVGCSSGSDPGAGPTTSVSVTGSSPSFGSTQTQPPLLSVAPEGFRAVTITIRTADGRAVTRCLLVADTEELREQGLMGVTDTDLAGYDGMLFVFEEDSKGGFWMKNTLIPLSIAFADAEGAVVGTADMVPCPPDTESCPVTKPDAAYRFAVEVPSGALEDVGLTDGSSLDPTLGPACTA
jgi:uncharacterized membrane protein (UPF0127 family)